MTPLPTYVPETVFYHGSGDGHYRLTIFSSYPSSILRNNIGPSGFSLITTIDLISLSLIHWAPSQKVLACTRLYEDSNRDPDQSKITDTKSAFAGPQCKGFECAGFVLAYITSAFSSSAAPFNSVREEPNYTSQCGLINLVGQSQTIII